MQPPRALSPNTGSSANGPALAGSHAALMDGVYRHQRHVYDLTRKYYLLGRDRLIESLRPADGQCVLEVGCGTGRNLIAVARRYPTARVHGIDISEMMLETARAKIARAGLSDRITVRQADGTAFDARAELGTPVDRLYFSYTLSMIGPWQKAITAGLDSLSRDGSLHVVDFGQQERLPSWARPLLQAWLVRFHVAPRADLAETLEAAARRAGRLSTLQPLYRGYAWLGAIV